MSAAEAAKSKNGLNVDPKFNGGNKRIGEPGTVNPNNLGPKNKTNFSHKATFTMKDGAKEWLQKNANPPLGHASGTYEIPADLVPEFNKRIKGITIGKR